MIRLRAVGATVVLGGCMVAGGGCSHIANLTPSAPASAGSASPSASGTASTSPTPAPSATPTGSCAVQTLDPNATIVISIDPDFAAATTSYGPIFGYAVFDPTAQATQPPTAQAVAAHTSDLIVFANYDPGLTAHSAVGFPGVSAFPAEPYSFPSSDASPVATSIVNAAWSTGSLASFGNTSSTICYSQTFSVPSPGTFYFGDDPLYNSPSSFRGVIVVSP